jgi:hypothetical protein
LCIGLLGLALFFGQLVFELLLIRSRRLADLFELMLKLGNSQLRGRHVLKQVDSTLRTIRQRLLQHKNLSVTTQKYLIRNKIRRKLTINATLRVTMAFCTTRISSLSSKISFC